MATLLISDMFPPKTGGSSRWFWEIYSRLPRDQFVIAAGEDVHQAKFDRTHDLQVLRLPLTFSDWGVFNPKTLSWYWKVLQQLMKIVRAEQIDQIHCGRSLPEGWMAWMLKQGCGIPYVCYVHGEEVNKNYVGRPTGLLTSRQLRWMLKRVLSDADGLIANSRSTKRILMDDWGLPESRIHLMYPGVDGRWFVPMESNEAERRRLGWTGRRVVLTVGRLDARKGHDQMIRALQRIRMSVPDVLYAIIGDGERREFLEALVEREGLMHHVSFLGEVEESTLLSCYQQCDLFVLPNRQVGNDIEGFGIVLVEAQACGKAVVAGDSGGTAETLWEPHTGRIVSCEDVHQLSSVVVELLTDPELRYRMGTAARDWVMTHFDLSVSRVPVVHFGKNAFRADSADGYSELTHRL